MGSTPTSGTMFELGLAGQIVMDSEVARYLATDVLGCECIYVVAALVLARTFP